jgi:hypothetical protein
MKQRCHNKSYVVYKDYGARGISVCDRWRDSFESFLSDMGSTYADGLQIDRIDFRGNYEPANCRWVNRHTQASNKSNNRFIELNGERLTHHAWSKKLGWNEAVIHKRMKRGWTGIEAITTPLLKGKNTPPIK